MQYALRWELDSFFPGSSLIQELKHVESAIDLLNLNHLSKVLDQMQEVDASLKQCDAFILCLQSQDSSDLGVNSFRAQISTLQAKFQLFENAFDAHLVELDEEAFQTLINAPNLAEIRFVIEERRIRTRQKLSCEKENLITSLSVDGYQGWGELYPKLVDGIKIPDESGVLSFGQAENKMTDAQRSVRQNLFHRLESAWKEKGPLFAQVLNHIAGFRTQVYAMRGWEDPLQEPLFENRMSQETLDALWGAVEAFKEPLSKFMEAKARLLNVEKLAWYDLEAPLFEGSGQPIPYDTAVELIIEGFGKFHPRMGEFARKACSEKWIEAEDRPGKRPGGFCVPVPKSRQSRIFMTYSGTMVNLSTLAHELGHGYHTAMVDDLPSFSQSYRMNVAETASTFAEKLISDLLLERAKTRQEKLEILSDRIQRSIAFMMNIHARFVFEKEFYQKRKTQFLSAEELCTLMKEAQKKGYGDTLSEWHPYFWAAKMHFYFTDWVPFYNFPYTFGFLFSLGIYNLGEKQGEGFGKNYDALLRESGMMSVEDLAKKHLGVDLTQPDFWRQACSSAVSDVEKFLALL